MELESLKQIVEYNTLHIQQLNQNIANLDQNVQAIFLSVKESIRDLVAIQQTLIQFLVEKGIVSEEGEDQKLFQRLYARTISQMDQDSAQLRNQNQPPTDSSEQSK